MKWIDLTDMLVWNGHYTGIQRVTYEYAIRFNRNKAKFFAYDAIDDRFFELDLQEVLDRHTEDLNMTGEEQPESANWKRKMRRVVGWPYYRLNDTKRAFMQPYATAANHTVRSLIHAVKNVKTGGHNPVPTSEYSAYSEASFQKDDVVVLLGAGWNEKRVLEGLSRLKKEIGFHISQHINDILPIYQPHLFADELPRYFMPYAKLVVDTADVITVISEATKRDMETFYEQQGVAKQPAIVTVRLGDNPRSDGESRRPTSIDAKEVFILSVGTFEIRKNYQLIYQAVKLAELEGRELPKIVIAGRRGWLSDDLRHVIARDPYVQSRIIWLSDVSDSELKWLYENCIFTLFPSLAEGWGLPIAESLGYGKMCLASGVSSMLEIGDGLVDYFLPYDARECMEKIAKYSEKTMYEKVNMNVVDQYKIFTWDDSFLQIVNAIER